MTLVTTPDAVEATGEPVDRIIGEGALRRFFIRRFLTLLVSLFVVSVLIFGLLAVLPGKPAQVILGTQATPTSVAALTVRLGLNRPVWLQYAHWVGGLVTGHLGTSYISGLPIGAEILQTLQVTGPLVGLGLIVGLTFGVLLGLLGAVHHSKVSGAVASSISQIGIAVPSFVAGILLVILFAVKLRWLPASGFTFWSAGVGQALKHLVLPTISLGLAEGAILSRYVRSAVVDVLKSDYLRTARAKGLRPTQALVRHGLRNASIPVVTILGLEVAGLLAGAVVVENVFTLPGLGTLLINAIQNRDLNLVEDIVMMIAGVVLVVNAFVDLSYRMLDPRLTLER